MTAAHDSGSEAMKEAAVLRSLAQAVASPVVAGRKSRKGLTLLQRSEWNAITDQVVTWPAVAQLLPEHVIADLWKKQCKTAGIGTGLFGWIVWRWAFPLLLELARLWIESRKQGQDSDR